MQALMLDIETLGTSEDLPPGQLVEVVEVAAVIFDPATGHEISHFHFFPAPNGVLTHATATWWITTAAKRGIPEWAKIRNTVLPHALEPLSNLLREMLEWLHDFKVEEYWSKGCFDFPILQAHLSAARLHTPWLYYQTRDLRTILKTLSPFGQSHRRPITPTHNALEDCRLQIDTLTTLLQTLRKAS